MLSNNTDKFLALVVIAVLITVAWTSCPAQDYIAVTVASKHFGVEPDDGSEYNEVNPGLGFVTYSAATLEAGCYENSFSDLSCFGMVGTPVRDPERPHFTAAVGFVTGYDWASGPAGLAPAVKGAVRLPMGPGLVSFELLPAVSKEDIGAVVGLQYLVRMP